jgi:hypothetical protein
MSVVTHAHVTVLGVSVRIDTVVAHGVSGYGFVLNGRTYTGGGYASPARARRAAQVAVRRATDSQERGREDLARSMRAMRTIGRGPA